MVCQSNLSKIIIINDKGNIQLVFVFVVLNYIYIFLFSQELNKCKTELQYWRSKSPLTSLCVCQKATTGLTPEDIQFLQGISPADEEVTANMEIWATPEPHPPSPPQPQALPQPLKRKPDDTPQATTSSKRAKKSRSLLKVRTKRS